MKTKEAEKQSRLARGPLLALADRAEIEAFCAHAQKHVRALERGIDRAYGRLIRGQAIAENVETMETEREEIILRMDEALAMLETMADDEGINVDGGIVPEAGFVPESFRNPRAPLPW